MSAPLYNRDILALAVATAEYLPIADARHRVSKRAPLCGSAIILDLDTDDAGRVTRVGMHVEACALGQASAALLARHAPGLGLVELRAARDGIASWFAGADAQPDWPGFDLLAPAQGYPARHGAILLPFDAAIAALEERAAAA
ncbi:Fe-S cluster protein [Sphingopyxis sp. H038]|uniref:iron-sulfur cluster assembly scaffold protein n=1 Tax=unclassified Sphingopyxis TaxID=2614943 RepID=UPI00072FB147|nr:MULTISPECIES: iron-sulfur cluster assembly scaffold protein [unclassified Sphingopyxis]KTE01666.1 Fe-S cluster protein [Sphingopyxis sp. H012]KTE11916.1 Fe-S cluster protein [Sphingopyxis sp. H053]KTE16179.1 Fe-S cluster protein [Sphingopyxis sp. H093]KTE29655.1 Fe-S cluster protein [Sphingopyxis sp. H080]KTE34497.1 Fe-S cluster protein [Sphingopyxis sp. H038]